MLNDLVILIPLIDFFSFIVFIRIVYVNHFLNFNQYFTYKVLLFIFTAIEDLAFLC